MNEIVIELRGPMLLRILHHIIYTVHVILIPVCVFARVCYKVYSELGLFRCENLTTHNVNSVCLQCIIIILLLEHFTKYTNDLNGFV